MSRIRFRDPQLEQQLLLNGLAPAAGAIFDDLTAYLRQPIEAVAHGYWEYHLGEDLLAQKRVAEATQERDVLAYYERTPHYLYELSYWEASRDKQAWFAVLARACRRYGLRRVMDFGGGVGGLALYLQSRGIACEHLDVAGQTFDYAAWRFQRRGLTVPMHNVLNGHPTGPFDAVMAWDVLEHLFDLDEALERIRTALRPGGWFISKSTFAPESGGHHEDIHLAKHACYSDVRTLNALLSRHGFRFTGQLKPSRASRLLRRIGWPSAVVGIAVVPRLKLGGNFLIHERVT